MNRSGGANPRGQTLVEFAIILPVLLMLMMGVFDLGRVVYANDMVSNAAREAARFAIVHGGSRITACPVGPPDLPRTVVPPASATCPHPSPSKEAIRQVARDWALSAGGAFVVQVCYGPGCSGDTDAPGATNAKGTPVTVTVSSPVTLTAPSIVGWETLEVSSASTMLVNN